MSIAQAFKISFGKSFLLFSGIGVVLTSFLFWLSAWAYEVPTPTDNEGMSKYERINKLESDTINLSKEFIQKANEQSAALKKLQEQNTQLETSLKKLQDDFSKFQVEMGQRLEEIKKLIPPPIPTTTPVPTANI